jgi:hypothetical protein
MANRIMAAIAFRATRWVLRRRVRALRPERPSRRLRVGAAMLAAAVVGVALSRRGGGRP